jgi:thiaminase/transcriptional activator TenA
MIYLPPPDSGGLCERLWSATAGLRQAIVEHPFNRGLADGTLPRETFAFYLAQDARYLLGFSRALAVASSRAADPDEQVFFARSAQNAIAVERGLHTDYLGRVGGDAVEPSPSAEAYISYLHAVALTEPYPVLAAALLPCFWIYAVVGEEIAAHVPDPADHPYGRWIATYADPDFAESVAQLRRVVDRQAEAAAGGTVGAMTAAFIRACEYEWMFWDSAWRRETWPTWEWVTGAPV